MSRGLLTALCILLIAPIAYCLYFGWATSKTDALVSAEGQPAALAWVKTEFGLSEAEFDSLEETNAAYQPRCEAMCMELSREREALASLVGKPTATAAEIAAAQEKVNAMEQRCFRMTLDHIYDVSQAMESEKGARYRKHMITELMGYRIGHHELLSGSTNDER